MLDTFQSLAISLEAMSRDQGYELPPSTMNLILLSCDRRQGGHMTSEGSALRPAEGCAMHPKARL